MDEWVGFYAPVITGGGVDGVEGGDFLEREAHLVKPSAKMFGDDVCIRGEVRYQ